MGNSYSCGVIKVAIRIPLIQINGRTAELPSSDKFHNKVIDSFIFEQTISSAIWTISHNMNKFPGVTVILNNNLEVYGSKKYVDSNTIELTFSRPISGKVYLN